MKLKDYMNPNRANEEVDISLASDTSIHELQIEYIDTAKNYVGVVDEIGNPIGAIRTERLEFLIKANREFPFEAILDNIPMGVIAVDKESRVFYVNVFYGKILNVDPGKIIGRYLKDIEKDAELLNVLKSRTPMKVENQLIKTVGKYVNTDMFPLFVGGDFYGAFSFFNDVTEINFLSDELERISQVANEYRKEILISENIVGESEAFRHSVQQASMVAGTNAAVLVRGENGTGKEVISKLIQENSERADKPFIKVNCAAIPESLMESELFGYEEGAFTGAKKGGSPGKFELANHGTIFLDEIGDIPMPMQAKLLRVLQENEITRVGGSEVRPIDVRVISATNQDLERLIKERKFRMDLYYRLNVVEIVVPPLRKRGNDVILLANLFLDEYNSRYGRDKKMDSSAYETLLTYSWPGNVRQLRNVIESAAILTAGDLITNEELTTIVSNVPPEWFADEDLESIEISGSDSKRRSSKLEERAVHQLIEDNVSMKDAMDRYEESILRDTIDYYSGDKHLAIKRLGLSERTFYRKLSKYGIK